MGTLTSRIQVLRSTRELGGWSRTQLESLLGHVDEVVVPAGCALAAEGRYCSQFVVVADGYLSASRGKNGQRTLAPGESFGWRAMWLRGTNEETLVAESDARLLVMGHAQFRAVKGLASASQAHASQL
jgi:CRP-like cAMP-binding protein